MSIASKLTELMAAGLTAVGGNTLFLLPRGAQKVVQPGRQKPALSTLEVLSDAPALPLPAATGLQHDAHIRNLPSFSFGDARAKQTQLLRSFQHSYKRNGFGKVSTTATAPYDWHFRFRIQMAVKPIKQSPIGLSDEADRYRILGNKSAALDRRRRNTVRSNEEKHYDCRKHLGSHRAHCISLLGDELAVIRASRDSYQIRHRHCNRRLSGSANYSPVRRTPLGMQVRLPHGAWIDCRADCTQTLKDQTFDFWTEQEENTGGGGRGR